MRYRFIARVKKAYAVKLQCQLLGVSRSGFYDFLRREKRDPDPEHEEKLGFFAQTGNFLHYGRRLVSAVDP